MARKSTLTGDKKLLRSLRSTSEAVQTRRLMDAAGIDALTPMRDEMNLKAPVSVVRGTAAIERRVARKAFGQYVLGFTGMGRRIAHLLEFGTAPHSLAKGASRRKNIMQDVPPFHPGDDPKPFARPAFEATKEEVKRRAGLNFWNIIRRSITK